jgi:hypothetical protein
MHSVVLRNLGNFARSEGDVVAAWVRYRDSLVVARDTDQDRTVAICLVRLAGLAAATGCYRRAAWLFGAEDAWRMGVGEVHAWRRHHLPGAPDTAESDQAAARAGLGDAAFAARFAEGQAMTLPQVIAYALTGSIQRGRAVGTLQAGSGGAGNV